MNQESIWSDHTPAPKTIYIKDPGDRAFMYRLFLIIGGGALAFLCLVFGSGAEKMGVFSFWDYLFRR